MATIKPVDPFYPDQDAEALHAAMDSFGTDEDVISQILTKRTYRQRQKIAGAFQEKYKQSLVDCLKSELSFNYKETVVAMIEEPVVTMAKFINKVVTNMFPTRDRNIDLLEIMFPLAPQEIAAIADAYKTTFNADMEDDVMATVSGPFEEILVSLASGGRSGRRKPNCSYVDDDARYFYENPPEKWQLPNKTAEKLFGEGSLTTLRAVFKRADQLFRRNNTTFIETVQRSNMDEVQKTGYLVIAKCIWQPIQFNVECLYNAMNRLGTDDDKLIWIIVGRSELDLVQIRTAFNKTYNRSLADMVTSDTSGDYMRILLEIIGK